MTTGTPFPDSCARTHRHRFDRQFVPLTEDPAFRDGFRRTHRAAKARFATWLKSTTGQTVDPDTIFDSQIKFMWTSHDPWVKDDRHHQSFFLEATMISTQYTTEDLKKLPLRAIVAFAARCARRVESLSQLPADHPQREARRVAIDNAIRLAEEIARGSACSSVDPVVQALDSTQAISCAGIARECAAAAAAAAARTAATVWLVLNPGESDRDKNRWEKTPEARNYLSRLASDSAEFVAMDAFTAAVEAADAVAYSDDFMRGAVHDYATLLGLHLGTYPEAGQPIDPSPDGPLGPL